MQSSVNFVLGDEFEFLTLTGTANTSGTGNAAGNVMVANAGANRMQGLAGADFFDMGLGGADTVEGGAGNDTFSLATAAQGVRIDLGAGTAQNGADMLTLMGIEDITGSGYADYLRGDAADNEIEGLTGDDWIIGSPGDDMIDGGGGIDMVSYVQSEKRVIVDLAQGMGTSGDARIDTYASVERVTGTRFDDYFQAGSDTQEIRGMNGFDWFVGAAGGQVFDGGAAFDTVSYVSSDGAISASLALGRGWTGDAADDRFVGIENMTGSRNSDTFTGDDGRNVLRGLAGDDVMSGRGGADRFFGNEGNDTFYGGSGWDRAYFSGARAEYDMTLDGTTMVVTHLADGADGVDRLLSIEAAVFADELVYL